MVSLLPSVLFFISAVTLFVIGRYAARLANLSQALSAAPASDRLRAIQHELRVDTERLTPQQRQKLADKYLKNRQARVRMFMQPLISAVIILASLYMILSSDFSASDKHWAFGTIGTVIGFWLKGQ